MKHIKSFGELNEGWLDWLWKKVWRVSFTAEMEDKKTGEPFSWRSHLTVKAKDEDEAESKFYDKWEEATKKLEHEPKVIVGSIKKTNKADKLNIEFPRSASNPGYNYKKKSAAPISFKKKEEKKPEEKKEKKEEKK